MRNLIRELFGHETFFFFIVFSHHITCKAISFSTLKRLQNLTQNMKKQNMVSMVSSQKNIKSVFKFKGFLIQKKVLIGRQTPPFHPYCLRKKQELNTPQNPYNFFCFLTPLVQENQARLKLISGVAALWDKGAGIFPLAPFLGDDIWNY